jgi:hypothetical protein
MVAKSFNSRLKVIEGRVKQMNPVESHRMPREDRLPFVQLLADEILVAESGITSTDYRDRFSELADLDRRVVRNMIFGFCQFGYFGSGKEYETLRDWSTRQPQAVT